MKAMDLRISEVLMRRRYRIQAIQHLSEVYQRNSPIKSPQSTQRSQISAIPANKNETAATSRFKTRMTQIAWIFTDTCAVMRRTICS